VILLLIVTLPIFLSGPTCSTESHGQGLLSGDMIRTTVTTLSYTTHAPIVIKSNADFVTQAWPGNGTATNPYVIQGLSITSAEVCVNISSVTVYFEIRDCLISSPGVSSKDGISIITDVYASHASILRCIIQSHRNGLYVYGAVCTVTNSTATLNSQNGFFVEWNGDPTHHSFLTGNTATNNSGNGFFLGESWYASVTNNVAINNENDGFRFINCDHSQVISNTASGNNVGFRVDESSYFDLTSNTATGNSQSGFYIGHGPVIYLTSNNATGNGMYGIVRSPAAVRDVISRNVMASNGVANGLDDGYSGAWYDDKKCGNFWSDYGGTGVYSISGSAGSVDKYPFGMEISINHPADMNYTAGSTGYFINWTLSGSFPDQYVVYRNGSSVGSGDWESFVVLVTVDGLGAGIYNYTLLVTDESGNRAVDTVIVSVLQVPTGYDPMLILGVGIGAVAVIILVVVIRKR
jgi:parallel beta-helix repeat protein